MWPFGPHKHHWADFDVIPVGQDGKRLAAIYVFKCHPCGAMKYDRVTGDGHQSTKIIDGAGKATP